MHPGNKNYQLISGHANFGNKNNSATLGERMEEIAKMKYTCYRGYYHIKKCRPEFLQNYGLKTSEELLYLLLNGSPGVVFKCLCVLTTRELDENVVETLKEVNNNGGTFKNRKLANNILRQLFPKQSKGLEPGASKQIGYVYFIQNKLTGLVKIGRTKNINRRLSIFHKNFPFAIKLLLHIKTLNYEKIELTLHKHFHNKRVTAEWFKLDETDIEQILKKSFPQEIKVLLKED